ncbi:uncharacterized protein SPAPADRAFT_62370 [Spathaspora passalidarum NRRL Y-27907]|uniref:Uncharacterized protein n=1 Tax=Spathaspora passalidarum (strain NRRL Y-27907 / 11-Y1) TaxID=619300 RepID=G3ARM3_SPAPN|nr:uncharacterized protein SPAPADRAFT_62370 [Spathaspora passalidarum NRRL Y-27907]EGW31776.1 hypothetical protein SPAPADRAFT_62370 [Spathaspora passalidarum NRRL Y-27907]
MVQHKPNIVFFPVDFTEFDNLIKKSLPDDSKEVIRYLHSCFTVYVIVNQQTWRSAGGRPDPFLPCFEKILPRCILPTYFKDIIREMARPMKTVNAIYIPDIPSALADSSQELIMGIVNQYPNLTTVFKKLGLPRLEIEEIEPACFTMYHEQENLISVPRDGFVPAYRLKVVSVLKHIRFQQYRLVTSEASWVSLDRGNGNVVKVSNAIDIFQNTNLTCGFCVFQHHGGVRINSNNLMCASVVGYTLPTHISTERFPTEPRFLKTDAENNHRVAKPRRKSRNKGKIVPILAKPGVLVNLKKSVKTV